MRVTRLGFHLATLVWLALVALGDIHGNTIHGAATNTQHLSDIYFIKVLFDVILGLWTLSYLRHDVQGTVTSATAAQEMRKSMQSKPTTTAAANDTLATPATPEEKADDVLLSVESLGFQAYVYYLLLGIYMIATLWMHYQGNREASGGMSIWYLGWSIADLALAMVAFNQFWHAVQGRVVKLVHPV